MTDKTKFTAPNEPCYSKIDHVQMTSKCGKDKNTGAHKAKAKCVTDVLDATGNKRETNVSLTSPQTLIEEKRLPQKPKEHRKLK